MPNDLRWKRRGTYDYDKFKLTFFCSPKELRLFKTFTFDNLNQQKYIFLFLHFEGLLERYVGKIHSFVIQFSSLHGQIAQVESSVFMLVKKNWANFSHPHILRLFAQLGCGLAKNAVAHFFWVKGEFVQMQIPFQFVWIRKSHHLGIYLFSIL